MLFDPNPKSRKEDLFGRDKELKLLKDSLVLNERLVVVYGLRRIGKTSFVRVALRELGYPYVIVDIREVHSVYGRVSRYELYSKMAEFFTSYMKFYEKLGFRLSDLFKRVKGFRVSEVGVELGSGTRLPDINTLLRSFNMWATKNGTRFIIAFDEAQYLRFSGGIRYDEVIAWAIDNLENITIIITGSEVGVLREFLRLENPKAPLYGRYRREIVLERYSREQSLEFLEKGFKELNISVPKNELEEVVDILDGIPGWLTLYGYLRSIEGLTHRETLNKVFREGYKLISDEIEKIIAPSRDRYLGILEAVARGAKTWKQIKTYVVYKTGPITDSRFTTLLMNLVHYSLLEKKDNEYEIADPIIKHLISSS